MRIIFFEALFFLVSLSARVEAGPAGSGFCPVDDVGFQMCERGCRADHEFAERRCWMNGLCENGGVDCKEPQKADPCLQTASSRAQQCLQTCVSQCKARNSN